MIAYSGELDRQKQAADIMEKYMAQEGLKLTHLIGPKTEHKYEPETKKELDQKFSRIVSVHPRSGFLPEVKFTTYTLRYNSNGWIRVDELERHWERAHVEGRMAKSNGVMYVSTTNVARLTLTVAPGNHWGAMSGFTGIVVDGVRVRNVLQSNRVYHYPHSVTLRKTGKAWKLADDDRGEQRKHNGLQGPIDDAFMDSFVVVRPTGKPMNATAHAWIDDELAHATNEWRNQFRGDAIVKADTEISDEDIANNHLILWGDPQSNRVLGRIARKLPARWSGESIRMAGKKFAADRFVPVFIFPNPLNPKRYVVVNSGFTFCEYGRSSNALQIPKLPDYAVMDTTVDRKSRYANGVALAGFFDETWDL